MNDAVRWPKHYRPGSFSSWHLTRPEASTTVCGRQVPADAIRGDEMPGNEATCERCLLISSRRAEDGGAGEYGNVAVGPV